MMGSALQDLAREEGDEVPGDPAVTLRADALSDRDPGPCAIGEHPEAGQENGDAHPKG